MTTEEYRYHLVAALRTYRVPAARIGEAVAEVESHRADTGEDPVDAFGEPADYARALSLDTEPRIDWATFAVAVVAFAGAGVMATALLDGDLVPAAVGAAVLVALGVRLHRTHGRDRIVDPRTGRTLTLPVPRWAFVVLAGSLVALIALSVWLRGR